MFARVSLSSTTPSLLLEDLDEVLSDVRCENVQIELSILPHAYSRVCKMIDATPEFYIITAHNGCNQYGGRLPYK